MTIESFPRLACDCLLDCGHVRSLREVIRRPDIDETLQCPRCDEPRSVIGVLPVDPRLGEADSVSVKSGRRPRRDERNHRVSSRLTDREFSIVRLVAAGMNNKQIADSLQISPHTVVAQLHRIYLKLRVQNRHEAVATAAEAGLL